MQFIRQGVERIRSYVNVSNAVLGIIVILLMAWLWSMMDAITQNYRLQQQVDNLTEENTVYELQNKLLSLQQNYYKSDEYLELTARKKLNKSFAGEKQVILPPNTVQEDPGDTIVSATGSNAQSNFSQWMYLLFGRKSK